MNPPKLEDVLLAATLLKGVARETPLLSSDVIDRSLSARLLFKAENLQIGGAYKFRGAYNRLCQLSPSERDAGVVAWSSGNHGVAIACAASLLGITATVVVPADAPLAKIEGAQSRGARLIFYDRYKEDRESIARAIAAETGATIVPSFDDPQVIAGQGTIALELIAQTGENAPDIVLVPCGGGGLASGCAIILSQLSPRTQLIAVEPAGADAMTCSLAADRVVRVQPDPDVICDALTVPSPSELTLSIVRGKLRTLVCSEAQVGRAMRLIFEKLKLVVEPSAALPLAAILDHADLFRGKSAVLVLTGAGLDYEGYCALAG